MNVMSVRRYEKSGKFIRSDSYKGLGMPKLKAFAMALLRMSSLFSHETVAPINPCNISVRGKGGKFVKWKD